MPATPGGNTFRLFFKGQPVAASRVNVETCEGWRRALTSAPDGTVSFTPSFPGLYVLEVSVQASEPGKMARHVVESAHAWLFVKSGLADWRREFASPTRPASRGTSGSIWEGRARTRRPM